MIKVMKFGGTSVGSGEAMDRTSDIHQEGTGKKGRRGLRHVRGDQFAHRRHERLRDGAARHGDKLREKHMQAATGKMDEDNNGSVPCPAGRPIGKAARPPRILSQERGQDHDPGPRSSRGGEGNPTPLFPFIWGTPPPVPSPQFFF